MFLLFVCSVRHIGFNTTGLLQFDPNYFDPGAQAAADVFGIYAYKALGLLRGDLIAFGSTNLVFHAILGSNGTKVFAKNSSLGNSYIQDPSTRNARIRDLNPAPLSCLQHLHHLISHPCISDKLTFTEFVIYL